MRRQRQLGDLVRARRAHRRAGGSRDPRTSKSGDRASRESSFFLSAAWDAYREFQTGVAYNFEKVKAGGSVPRTYQW